jgi:LysM repeat protein
MHQHLFLTRRVRYIALVFVAMAVALAVFAPTVAYASASHSKHTYHGHHYPGHGPSYQHCAAVYVVKKGDSLSKIGRYFGVSVSALQHANRIHNPNRIVTGQRLCIPQTYQKPSKPHDGKVYYTVKKGDSLSLIARHYRISVRTLMQWNNVKNPHRIYTGQVLRVR